MGKKGNNDLIKDVKIMLERKQFLDYIMQEYYYEKNTTDQTLEFLAHMYMQYKEISSQKDED